MSFWAAVVTLAAIASFTWLRAQKYRALGGMAADPGGRSSVREHELEAEVERLRQRIAVLERIALEERDGSRLSREIESLRY